MSQLPNVVLISISGARADRLSCYGHPLATTPIVDSLAEEGTRVVHAMSCAPTTTAGHAALLTGRFSAEHGAHEEGRQLTRVNWSVAEILRQAGYATAAFCSNPAIGPEVGFGRGFDRFMTQRRQSRLADRAWSYGRRAGDRLLGRRDAGARRTTEAVREWLGTTAAPFFAFIHYDEPCFPLVALPDMAFATAADLTRLRGLAAKAESYALGAATLQPEDIDSIGRAYDSALHYVDARIGEVIEAMDRLDQLDNTLLIVVGDHGQYLGEGGLVGDPVGLKDCLLHVPLLVRQPGVIPPGLLVEELAQTVDVAPSIVGTVLGADACAGMSGRMLVRDGRATAGSGCAIAERYRPDIARWRRAFPQGSWQPFDVRVKCIRTKTEKFVWRSDEQNELYDLRTDPAEQHNRLAQDLDQGDRLRRQLFDWFAEVERQQATEAPHGPQGDCEGALSA